MPRARPVQDPEATAETESKLRPDQKRCGRCKAAVFHEQRRCPFCGNAPWLWQPNARFLLVTIAIALLALLLMPLVSGREKPYRVPVSQSP